MIESQTRRRRPPAAEAGPGRPRTKPSEVRRRELLDAGEALVLRKGIVGACIAAARAKRDPADWPAQLAAWLEGGVQGYLDQVELHDVLFHTPDFLPRQRRVDGHMEPVRGLVDLLRNGAAAGSWAVDDPEMTAVLLFYAFHGGVDHAIADGRTDVAGLVAELQTFVRRALGIDGLDDQS